MAIAHDFAETFGGAERVVGILAEAFPQANVHFILARPEIADRMGLANRYTTSLPASPPLLRHYRALAPLYPLLVRAQRLPEADVLISSSYAFAHGFRTVNDAPRLCYCHSPLRFAWTMTEEYGRQRGRGLALKALSRPMRAADRTAAAGVARYVANSQWVADQIERFYGRSAEVLHPPVDTNLFRPAPSEGHDGYFLFCGRLVEPYKRPTLAVEAFRTLPHRLIVAGDGPELGRLRKLASPNVEFVGRLEDRELIPLMQRCAAALFPSRDDFGMTPVEVMACGRPVLAYAAGGALETVAPGRTGELFDRQDVACVRKAVQSFDPDRYDESGIRTHAKAWGIDHFTSRIRGMVQDVSR